MTVRWFFHHVNMFMVSTFKYTISKGRFVLATKKTANKQSPQLRLCCMDDRFFGTITFSNHAKLAAKVS